MNYTLRLAGIGEIPTSVTGISAPKPANCTLRFECANPI